MKSIQSDENYESHIINSLLIDYRLTIDVLPPAACKKYLDYDKKSRSYHCPRCANIVSRMDFWDDEFIHHCAKTYQRLTDSDEYSCKLCSYQGKLLERSCEELGCEGKLQDSESGICFSCFVENAL